MLVTMSDRQASASAADPLPLPRGEGRGECAGSADDVASHACATGSASVPPAVTGDDADMLAKAAAGDSAAFDGLVRTHQEQITRLVHRLLGWPNDVDDVVQDVFVDVLRNLSRFDGRSTVLTWITRIAINRCRSHQRRQWLRLRFLRTPPLPRGEGWGEGAGDQLETQETAQQVHQAIQQLNGRDREIIVLRYLEELPVEQIAEMLGATRGAIDVRLSRARRRLEAILKPLLEE
jgi:RNA polymerase sigma factor (sigma-70 family)